MADRLNSRFNYQYLVNGKTPWEKIKILKGFLQGRYRARALEEVSRLNLESKRLRIEELLLKGAPRSQILELQADLVEIESVIEDQAHAFKLNHEEIADLEELILQLYDICEPTRIAGYSDDQMFEANAPFEFAVTIVQQIQSEIIALGHPLPATLLNAMGNPYSLEAIKHLGIVPRETNLLGISDIHKFVSGNNVPYLRES